MRIKIQCISTQDVLNIIIVAVIVKVYVNNKFVKDCITKKYFTLICLLHSIYLLTKPFHLSVKPTLYN